MGLAEWRSAVGREIKRGARAGKEWGRLRAVHSHHAVDPTVLPSLRIAPAMAGKGKGRRHASHGHLANGEPAVAIIGSAQVSGSRRRRHAGLGARGRCGLEGIDRSIPIGPVPAINAVPLKRQRIQVLAGRLQEDLLAGQVEVRRPAGRAALLAQCNAKGHRLPKKPQENAFEWPQDRKA